MKGGGEMEKDKPFIFISQIDNLIKSQCLALLTVEWQLLVFISVSWTIADACESLDDQLWE